MSFVEMLTASIGKTVEVILVDQMFIGVLTTVNSSSLTLEGSGGQYYYYDYGPSNTVTISLPQIQSVHIIS
ncbi:hypothetical protein [Paenibacillus hexagrammi]|uniref:DUF2642 domain-containing protein n=1 Tax=Paenibacillus hexagrammi TaxID=2908839 RepID=A0ABY3SP32_9BACL|nr:hypothetical protein [Paenibacillus sp. YPD9-1]UJF35782.1 hypothetical protein L0M14_12260 [Paenibacillus sp. YPD9-1]